MELFLFVIWFDINTGREFVFFLLFFSLWWMSAEMWALHCVWQPPTESTLVLTLFALRRTGFPPSVATAYVIRCCAEGTGECDICLCARLRASVVWMFSCRVCVCVYCVCWTSCCVYCAVCTVHCCSVVAAQHVFYTQTHINHRCCTVSEYTACGPYCLHKIEEEATMHWMYWLEIICIVSRCC